MSENTVPRDDITVKMPVVDGYLLIPNPFGKTNGVKLTRVNTKYEEIPIYLVVPDCPICGGFHYHGNGGDGYGIGEGTARVPHCPHDAKQFSNYCIIVRGYMKIKEVGKYKRMSRRERCLRIREPEYIDVSLYGVLRGRGYKVTA